MSFEDRRQIDESEETSQLEEITTGNRRKFLSIIPVGIFGFIAASLAVASKRFLDPPFNPEIGVSASQNWKTLGAIAEMKGDEPLAQVISVESNTGWSKTVEDVTVYVLPKHDHQVLSSVCPHEGCPIVWDSEKKNFACPCHDSFFSDSGKKLTGPSSKDLTVLEKRVEAGKLQINIKV